MQEQKITKMMFYEIQYESETREYMYSNWILLRREQENICKDFVKIDKFQEDDILEDLCLMTKREADPSK